MIKLLHTADLHLDWPFPSFPADRRAVRRREIAGIFTKMVEAAVEKDVQAMVLAGDLFQSRFPPVETEETFISGCRILENHGITIFISPGHASAEADVLNRLELPGNVQVLDGRDQSVSTVIPGLTVYGFPGHGEASHPLEDFHCINHPGLHLGIIHGFYRGLPRDPGQAPNWTISPEDIARSGLDYLALGHYHTHFSCVHGGTAAVYPGSPARLSFEQRENRAALLVGLTEGRPSIEPVSLQDRPYYELTFDLSGQPFTDVLAQLTELSQADACIRVVLQGDPGEETAFFTDRIMERFDDSFFYLEVCDSITITASSSSTVENLFSLRCRSAVPAPSSDPGGQDVLDHALRLGLTALRRGGALS